MKKKWFLRLMPLLLVAVLLIGCGGITETPTAPSTSPPKEQPGPNSTPAPSSEPTATPESEPQSPAPSSEPTATPESEPQSPAPSSEPTVTPESEPQSPAPSVEEHAPTPSRQARSWDEAKYYIGEIATVYGTVVSTRYVREVEEGPTFLYIGNSYPALDRFTVVIWSQDRGNFANAPERYYAGKTIYVRGLITEDEGVPQIEVKTPGQIRIQQAIH